MSDSPQTTTTVERVLHLLADGDLTLVGLMPDSSNYTFLTEVTYESLSTMAIYKPRLGERPLWDFPQGTLCQRERAAYLISAALGWFVVPPTVLRDAEPHGVGSLQMYIDADPEAHYFVLRGQHDDAFRRMAAFDIITNNADRKGGHVLQGSDGHIWGIDHGITFHAEAKLRTVIWEYAGQPLPAELVDDLRTLQARLADGDDPLSQDLQSLLNKQERAALQRRVDRLVQRPQYPQPGGNRSVPWPPI